MNLAAEADRLPASWTKKAPRLKLNHRQSHYTLVKRATKRGRSNDDRAPRSRSTALAWLLATFGVAACTTQDASESTFGSAGTTDNLGTSGASETGSEGPTSNSPSTGSSTAPATTDTTGTTGGPGSSEDSTSSASDTSGGEAEPACSILEQDCPDGQKCTIWASQGGELPDDVRCVPIVDGANGSPGVVGDACQVAEPLSGQDDCARGLYCQVDDPVDQVNGACLVFCRSVSGEQDCDNPDDVCGLLFGGVAPVCLSPCVVEADECPEGQVCHMQSIGPTVCVGEGWGA